jgi:hypothetical protein
MTLKNVINSASHGGLFTLIRPARHDLLEEGLNDQKKRSIKQLQDYETATLEDMNMYTAEKEEILPLCTLLGRLRAGFSTFMNTDFHDTPDKLHGLMNRLAPNLTPKGCTPLRSRQSSIGITSWAGTLPQFPKRRCKQYRPTA